MNFPAKPANVLQTYQVVLYNKALHPELFPLRARRVVKKNDYELEAWVMPGQHVLRFEYKGLCACELVTDLEARNVPGANVVRSFPCAGEHDFEHSFPRDGVNYLTTVQTETLAENLYNSTYDELLAMGKESSALAHRWNDESGRCLSMVDVQRMNKEVHCQGYHLISNIGLVLRTMTIFEHR